MEVLLRPETDVLRDMIGALRGATIAGIRSGTTGEPFPETVEQRDKSRDIANDLPAGSIEKRRCSYSYSYRARSADGDILRDVDDDLRTDGRAW